MSLQHIHSSESSESSEKSAMESERDLWVASEKYMRGEIGMEKLQEIELSSASDFKAATIGLARERMRWLFAVILVLWLLIAIVSCIIVLLFIHDIYILAIVAIPAAVLVHTTASYLFISNEKKFEIEKKKIQVKAQRTSRGLQFVKKLPKIHSKSTLSKDEEETSLRYHLTRIIGGSWKLFKSTSLATRIVLVFVVIFMLSFLMNILIQFVNFSVGWIYTVVGILATTIVIYEFLVKKQQK